MFFKENEMLLKEFSRVSKTAGARADYVQGGGGNTSVKFANGLMAIKASGFCLSDIEPDKAYAVLDGADLRNFYLTSEPEQFENVENVKAHYQQTAQEIINQAGCTIDGFCAGIGTGGTLTGVGQALKNANPNVVIWGVEPANASPLTGGQIGTHVQMGIGDGMIPPILDKQIFDKVVTVTDQEAIAMARELGRLEGLACGITSGTNVVVAKRLAKLLGPGKTVVTILPDTAERYFSTPLFD